MSKKRVIVSITVVILLLLLLSLLIGKAVSQPDSAKEDDPVPPISIEGTWYSDVGSDILIFTGDQYTSSEWLHDGSFTADGNVATLTERGTSKEISLLYVANHVSGQPVLYYAGSAADPSRSYYQDRDTMLSNKKAEQTLSTAITDANTRNLMLILCTEPWTDAFLWEDGQVRRTLTFTDSMVTLETNLFDNPERSERNYAVSDVTFGGTYYAFNIHYAEDDAAQEGVVEIKSNNEYRLVIGSDAFTKAVKLTLEDLPVTCPEDADSDIATSGGSIGAGTFSPAFGLQEDPDNWSDDGRLVIDQQVVKNDDGSTTVTKKYEDGTTESTTTTNEVIGSGTIPLDIGD